MAGRPGPRRAGRQGTGPSRALRTRRNCWSCPALWCLLPGERSNRPSLTALISHWRAPWLARRGE